MLNALEVFHQSFYLQFQLFCVLCLSCIASCFHTQHNNINVLMIRKQICVHFLIIFDICVSIWGKTAMQSHYLWIFWLMRRAGLSA